MFKPSPEERPSMSEVTSSGIDLAKRVIQVHGARKDGSVVVRKWLSRGQLLAFGAEHPRCGVAMEACATAHGWGRVVEKVGHGLTVRVPLSPDRPILWLQLRGCRGR